MSTLAIIIVLIIVCLLMPARYDPVIRLKEWVDKRNHDV